MAYLVVLIYFKTVFTGCSERDNCDEFRDEFDFVFWVVVALFLVGLPALWLTARFSVHQQVRLARNAKRVMNVMTSDLPNRPPCPVKIIVADLPWLGSYDRRDVHVVHQIIGSLRPDLRIKPSEERALAFSAYWAARFEHSNGNGMVRQLSLRDWLAEKDLVLDASPDGGMESIKSGRSRASSAGTNATDVGRETQTWLDGTTISNVPGTLSLSELQHFGWTAHRGARSALYCPFGAILVSDPDEAGVWRMGSACAFEPPRLSGIVAFIFSWRAIRSSIFDALALVLLNLNLLAPGTFRVLRAFGWSTTGVVQVVLVIEVLRKDLAHVREGRAPFPILVFDHLWQTICFASFAIVGPLIMYWQPFYELMSKFVDDVQAQHYCKEDSGGALAAIDRYEIIQFYLFQGLFYAYLLFVYAVHVAYYCVGSRQASGYQWMLG